MNHDNLAGKITDLDDDELAPKERAELEAHLSACSSCRRSLEAWRGARRVFFAASPKPTRQQTEFFTRAVMARLEKPAVSWWRPLLAPALSLAFAATAVALAMPRTPSDPAEALIERDSGLYSFASTPAPSGPDEVLNLAEGR